MLCDSGLLFWATLYNNFADFMLKCSEWKRLYCMKSTIQFGSNRSHVSKQAGHLNIKQCRENKSIIKKTSSCTKSVKNRWIESFPQLPFRKNEFFGTNKHA